MLIQIYGFHWDTYAQRIMPIFSNWITEAEETEARQLYNQTRCAQEEGILPPTMKRLQSWSRAKTFVHQLPRGPYAYREYQKLCQAEQFTDLSDRYLYHHPPQLPQQSDALRAVWGAIIEEFCLAPYLLISEDTKPDIELAEVSQDSPATARGELVELLHEAGFNDLAQEVRSVSTEPLVTLAQTEILENTGELREESEFPALDEEEIAEASRNIGPEGIELGRYPSTLHLRGWLSTISIRAMALFELLACGRRCMPFGYRAGEPFESFIGYLTPDEVWHLALCLRNVQAPARADAEEEYRQFRQIQATQTDPFRMIDEIAPTHAHIFIKAVRAAASQGLGLICRIE